MMREEFGRGGLAGAGEVAGDEDGFLGLGVRHWEGFYH